MKHEILSCGCETFRYSLDEILSGIKTQVNIRCDRHKKEFAIRRWYEKRYEKGKINEKTRDANIRALSTLNIREIDYFFLHAKKDFKNVVAHNRACLLKERDILLKRGYRTPDKIELVRIE